MNVLTFFIGPLIGVIVATIIMKIIYKDADKKDKGFVLNYHRLSYRRKFIRSLWGVPVAVLAYLGLYWLDALTAAEYRMVGIIFLIIMALDLTYHYLKWKKSEKEA